ncbi:hypothetical protein QUF79_04190 [Fictibacillus enclensis]|uniref:hypothetical protein n=1 Tax=Fictibacillus enclensis TaxID=1017270 RepID=UPI0025A118AD|nr:hypothetical protein [Fictibacillus enclensis]MDM5197228.1 hypothetical protein [Fictibacillus enclensis]
MRKSLTKKSNQILGRIGWWRKDKETNGSSGMEGIFIGRAKEGTVFWTNALHAQISNL